MKKSILSVLILSALAVPAYAQSTTSIAVVDVQNVLTNFTEAQSINQKLQSDVANMNRALQDKATTGIQMQKDLEAIGANAGNPQLSDAARDLYKTQYQEKAKDLQAIDDEITKMRQDSIDTLNKEQTVIMQEEIAKIRTAVSTVAKKHGSTLVLNSSSIGAVVFNDTSMDITKEVIDTLNAGATPLSTGTAIDGGTLLPSSGSNPMTPSTPTLLTPSSDTGTKPLAMPPSSKSAAGTSK